MVEREEIAVEVLTVLGWYRGRVTVTGGGRLLDYLNTKPDIIALTGATVPGGATRSFVALNTEQIFAIRPAEDR
jgi:hypothetical protein